MPALPSQPLHKADLRHVLALERSPTPPTQPTVSPPTPSALRAAKQWARAAQLLTEQGLTISGDLAVTKDSSTCLAETMTH